MSSLKPRVRTQCEHCATSFSVRSDYLKHARKKHHDIISLTWHNCNACNLLYPTEENLESHQRSRHMKRPPGETSVERVPRPANIRTECTYCTKVLSSARKFYTHANAAHKSEISKDWLPCDICSVLFPNPMVLYNHKKARNCEQKDKTNWIQCQFCPKVFSRAYLYFKHANREHPDSIRDLWIPCKECPLKMPSESAIKHHMFGHSYQNRVSKDISEKTLCSFCPETFYGANGYYKHANRMHQNLVSKEWFICSECTNHYPTPEILAYHISSKHKRNGPGVGEINCQFCSRVFSRNQRYIEHANIKHSEEIRKVWDGCNNCSNFFPNKKSTENHKKRAHSQKGLNIKAVQSPTSRLKTCQFCPLVISGMFKYYKHARKSHAKEILNEWLPCDECKSYFPTPDSLNQHRGSAHGVRKSEISCQFCPKTFLKATMYTRHANNRHRSKLSKEWHECKECNYFLITSFALQKHMNKKHVGVDVDAATKNGDTDSEKSTGTKWRSDKQSVKQEKCDWFSEHILEEQIVVTEVSQQDLDAGPEEKYFVAHDEVIVSDPEDGDENCIRAYYNDSSVTVAISEYFEDEPQIKCGTKIDDVNNDEKWSVFINTSETVETKREVKLTAVNYECDKCSKSFRSNVNLQRHTKTCQSEEKQICEECQKTFVNVDILKKHVKEAHKDKSIECRECGRLFGSNVDLVHHCIKSSHASNFKCQKCSETFDDYAPLKEHLKSHEKKKEKKPKPVYLIGKNGEKYLECDECGKRFSAPSYLQKHMNAVHLDLREHKCQDCGKDFSYKAHLKKHILNVHLNQKNFQCDQCGKSFFERRRLSQHIKFHHEKPEQRMTIEIPMAQSGEIIIESAPLPTVLST